MKPREASTWTAIGLEAFLAISVLGIGIGAIIEGMWTVSIPCVIAAVYFVWLALMIYGMG
jgi:uncharacterized membrane protein